MGVEETGGVGGGGGGGGGGGAMIPWMDCRKSTGSTHTPRGGFSNRDGLNECNNCQKAGKPLKTDTPSGLKKASEPYSSDDRTQSGTKELAQTGMHEIIGTPLLWNMLGSSCGSGDYQSFAVAAKSNIGKTS